MTPTTAATDLSSRSIPVRKLEPDGIAFFSLLSSFIHYIVCIFPEARRRHGRLISFSPPKKDQQFSPPKDCAAPCACCCLSPCQKQEAMHRVRKGCLPVGPKKQRRKVESRCCCSIVFCVCPVGERYWTSEYGSVVMSRSFSRRITNQDHVSLAQINKWLTVTRNTDQRSRITINAGEQFTSTN